MTLATRGAALSILTRNLKGKGYASALLSRAARNPEINYPLLQRLVKGTLLWQKRLEGEVKRVLPGSGLDHDTRLTLVAMMAAYQSIFLKEVPFKSMLQESLKLVNPSQRDALRRAIERLAKQRSSPTLIERGGRSARDIANNYSHPEWLVRRWIKELGLQETIKLCEINNSPWPVHLRVNVLRINPWKLKARLAREGLKTKPGCFLDECLRLEQMPRRQRLSELESYRLGLFQVQDESSALVGHFLDPKPGEFVIDLCAAPGGKTTHIASLMHNRGQVLACDLNENRLRLVRENCRRLGIKIVKIRVGDIRRMKFGAKADAVLLDAPCSGLGVLGRKADIRWAKSEKNIGELVALQKELLDAAAMLVKPGGRLVYSTCTLVREENEGQVFAFLKRHSDFAVAKPNWAVPKALQTRDGFMYSWPHRHFIGGMFAALLVRKRY